MMNSTSSLEGKVALITGGGRGIGKAIARRFASAGATVVIASRKVENLEATTRELGGLTGRVIPIGCHVGRVAVGGRLRLLCVAVHPRVEFFHVLTYGARSGEKDESEQ